MPNQAMPDQAQPELSRSLLSIRPGSECLPQVETEQEVKARAGGRISLTVRFSCKNKQDIRVRVRV